MNGTNFARMDLFIELKSSNSVDAALSRGLLARLLCSYSATTHSAPIMFSVPLCRARARLIRWDRSGGYSTKSFNY
ncbi:hypothetical protein BS47DRAFT_1356637, partial [Hydnum rufescens UP504]